MKLLSGWVLWPCLYINMSKSLDRKYCLFINLIIKSHNMKQVVKQVVNTGWSYHCGRFLCLFQRNGAPCIRLTGSITWCPSKSDYFFLVLFIFIKSAKLSWNLTSPVHETNVKIIHQPIKLPESVLIVLMGTGGFPFFWFVHVISKLQKWNLVPGNSA